MKRGMSLVAAVWVALLLAPAARGWQSDAPDAFLAVEIDFEHLQSLGLDKLQDGLPLGPMNRADLAFFNKAARVSVTMSAPEGMAALQNQGPGQPLPFEFFARLDFKEPAGREQLMEMMKEGFEEATENGEKLFKANEQGPANVRLRLVDDKSLEMGTLGYMATKDLQMSSKLNAVWAAAPKHAVRIALDLEAAASLVEEAVAAGAAEAPKMMQPFLELIPKISTVRLSLDGSDKTLLSLAIDGKDEAAAEELFGALEGLLGMAKMGSAEGIKQLREKSPKMAEAATAIVEALNSKRSGKTVSLDIPRPEGLGDLIKEAAGAAEESSDNAVHANRLKQAALAVHSYTDAHRQLPFTALQDNPKDGGKWSWRVCVLPFVEEDALSRKIDLSKDIDAPVNAALARKMPRVFGRSSKSESDIVWVQPEKPPQSFSEISDGLSNTIMFVRVNRPMARMDPANITPKGVVKLPGELKDGEDLHVAFYHGSVRNLRKNIAEETLRRILDPADGQVLGETAQALPLGRAKAAAPVPAKNAGRR